jgi:CBS domain-containing protein
LLQASIFFDFRGAYGDFSLVENLQRSLYRTLDGWPGFFRHLSENALQVKPPLGFFRNFVVESMGGHRNVLDIKSAMVPIVDFARVYALKNKIPETNTMDRLKQLLARNALSKQAYDDLQQGYGFMMQLRIIRQIKTIADDGRAPDNYINPQKLSQLEQIMLKEIFKCLEKYQNKLSFDFLGGT